MADEPTETAVTVAPEKRSVQPKPADNGKIAERLKARVESAKRVRKQRRSAWKRNVDTRIGHNALLYTAGVNVEDEIQSEINPDWALTKTKTANLYSQVPSVQATHANKAYAPAIAPFMKELNYQLGEKRMNVGAAMEEALNDVVNASGIAFVFVGYAARFEQIDVPAIDTKMLPPEAVQQMQAMGTLPMTKVDQVVDYKFFANRISPMDGLTPAEFTGSDFDKADWVGFTGKLSKAEATHEFKLTDEELEQCISADTDTNEDSLRSDPDRAALSDTEHVRYDELYYWRYRVDPDEKSFHAIWKIVYIHGLDTPKIHEPWKGQQFDPQTRKYVGNSKFPIRVLTLTYITDNPVPPSDSAAGRPQVNDMRRSRSQMFQNRTRSLPIRWYDINRIDPTIQDSLMRGTFQGFIPTNGDGSRSVGEIARASYPSEDITFDQATKADLMETWQIGPNQLGTSGGGQRTASETETVQANFATRIGQERGRVASVFLSVCEVTAGWMVLYSDFPSLDEQEKQVMQQAWDQKHVLHDLVMTIRPDSQLVLDTSQRLDRIFKFINMTAKSGFVNVKPLIEEAAELSGIDPADVVIDPPPPTPEGANISYRFSGKDDLINPMVVALLIAEGKAPTAEQLQDAVKLLESVQMPAPLSPPPAASSQPEAGNPGAPGPPPPGPVGAPGSPSQSGPQADAHPEWSLASKVAARSRDIGGTN